MYLARMQVGKFTTAGITKIIYAVEIAKITVIFAILTKSARVIYLKRKNAKITANNAIYAGRR